MSNSEVDQRPIALRARNVAKSYKMGGEILPVLQDVNLDVREGEILAILGKSGCGKSTLLHVLGWLDSADEGELHFDGRDRAHVPAKQRAILRNDVMGFVFQFYHLLPELTALENVCMPSMIRYRGSAWRRNQRASMDRARELLDLVGLGARMKHRPRQLSGGERQRVAIARALQNKPRFLFCDEPTGNLDGKTAGDIRDLLWGLNAENNQTMVVVTHDAKLAAQAHRTVYLASGRIQADQSTDFVEEVEI